MSFSPGGTASAFYWTDKKLHTLIGGYYSYLSKCDVNSTPRRCLTHLKILVDGKPTVQNVRKKLDWIYCSYTKELVSCFLTLFPSCFLCQNISSSNSMYLQGFSYVELEDRLGTVGMDILKHLFKNCDFKYYDRESANSSKSWSHGEISRCQTSSDACSMSSCRMAQQDLDKEINDVQNEVKKLQLDEATEIHALCRLTDAATWKIFLTIENDEQKRRFVLECIK